VLTGAGTLPDKDCTARLWETATGREVLRLEGHTTPVTVVALSRDNRQALSVSQKTIRIWELETGGASDSPRP
jgi:WD40 repeat protein